MAHIRRREIQGGFLVEKPEGKRTFARPGHRC